MRPDSPPSLIAADDRGLAYGDGVFETVRWQGGRAPLWPWHLARLQLGCARLGLPEPAPQQLAHILAAAQQASFDGVLKLIWTAGSGPRGYRRAATVEGRLIHFWGALPQADSRGLRLAWCRTRLSRQPALAGLKHLNRLEQVLAANEWAPDQADEGLMRDGAGQVIAATAANLVALIGGRWYTPALRNCGVAGVGRRWLMATQPIEERALKKADIEGADQLVLINALRGPRWVASLHGRRWTRHAEVAGWEQRWQALFDAGSLPLPTL